MEVKPKIFDLMQKKRELRRCSLCSSCRATTLYVKFNSSIVRCLDCGLVYAFPQPEEGELLARCESPLFFRDYLSGLRATESAYDERFIREHFRIFFDLANQFYFPGAKLLDLGCAAGFFVRLAIDAGWEAEGVEISNLAADYAEKIVGVRVHRGQLETVPFPPEHFDLITMFDLLEHLSNPLSSLKIIRNLLKKGGHLLITTPDFASLNRLLLREKWAVLSPKEHLFYFTARTLRSIIKRSGFKVKGVVNLLIFNPAYVHDSSDFISQQWRRFHSWIEKRKFMEKLHGVEYLDLIRLAGQQSEKTQIKIDRKIKRLIYKKLKPFLRGDILCLLAQKEN